MTLKELRQKYAAVLGPEVLPDDLYKLPQGQAVFYAIVRPGYKPKDDRRVTAAGFGLPMYMTCDHAGNPLDVSVLGKTPSGAARFVFFTRSSMLPENDRVLFLTNPVPPGHPDFNRMDWTKD